MADKPWWRDPRGMPSGLATHPKNAETGTRRTGQDGRRRGWLVLIASLAVLLARILLGVTGVSSGYSWLLMSIGLSAIALPALAIAAFKPHRHHRKTR